MPWKRSWSFSAVNGQELSRLRYGQKISGQIYACFSCLVSAEKVRSLVQSLAYRQVFNGVVDMNQTVIWLWMKHLRILPLFTECLFSWMIKWAMFVATSKQGSSMTIRLWVLQCREKEGLELHGKHDVDRQWIDDVRQDGSPMVTFTVVVYTHCTCHIQPTLMRLTL